VVSGKIFLEVAYQRSEVYNSVKMLSERGCSQRKIAR